MPSHVGTPAAGDVPASGRAALTVYGRRNWETIVASAGLAHSDLRGRFVLVNALAGLVSEVTPAHREVLASRYARLGAVGRLHVWALPPAVAAGLRERQRWSALVFLDCVDAVSDSLTSIHGIEERLSWRQAALRYTQGMECAPGQGRHL